MTPEQARTALIALLAPFNAQLDSLDALTPAALAQDPTAIASYVDGIGQVWPAATGAEPEITALQDQQLEATDPVDVDAFWRRLHQAKQLGVTLGYQP